MPEVIYHNPQADSERVVYVDSRRTAAELSSMLGGGWRIANHAVLQDAVVFVLHKKIQT